MPTSPLIYLIACAAPPTGGLGDLVRLVRARGYRAGIVLTPQAIPFAGDLEELEALSGNPVRSAWRRPDQDRAPDPDAVIVAPATFNSINKLACGIADTLGAAIACEAIGIPVPVVVATSVKGALARHLALAGSLSRLRACGVRVVSGEGEPPSAPMPAWERVVEELDAALRHPPGPV